MWDGLITQKLGMTEVFRDDGKRVPVTILRVLPAQVIQILTKESGGYSAIKVGYAPVSPDRLPIPVRGVYDAINRRAALDGKQDSPESEPGKGTIVDYYRNMIEFRTDDPHKYEVGTRLSPETIQVGEKVDVTGYTKGRGFAGVVKRYRFGGGKDSHGTSVIHRRPNSIGCRWPQRVVPGKLMAGHMGNQRKTVKNLEVLRVEGDLIYVKGSVPGPGKGVVVVRPAKGWGGRSK